MLAMKMALTLFLPWQLERAAVTHVLHHVAVLRIIESMLAREFPALWTDPLQLQVFRTRCLQCGLALHPAESRDHVTSVHPSVPAAYDKLLPQMLTALSRGCHH